ncbi:MAG TPA: oligosaccharide flippase family protein [Roseiarcus sp.]|nr:oligosaccharide flippase family protein [Roseiarcus sp.]
MMSLLARGYSLVIVSVIENGVPFVRMLMLSRGLTLRELGFSSALAATYGSFELITDFAVYRFVFSAPRDTYEEAMASAHALSLLRGAVVGGIAAAAAPLVARALSLAVYWPDFAVLGLVVFIRSLEHLGPRVAERDYRYGAQLKVNFISNGMGLAALAATLLMTRSHIALLASLLAQATSQVAASHLLADSPYRLKFRSPLFVEAFRFGYPLMFNGMGIAASAHGDRFIVGALLGLPTLGVYAVATLATYLPISLIGRLAGTTLLAAFYNATHLSRAVYQARVRLAARLVPAVSAVYAVSVLTLMNILVPLVFGPKFRLSSEAVAILALTCFFRLVRGDPFTSMLMQEGRTRRLAAANLASTSAVAFELVLIFAFGTLESVLAGRLIGELAGLGVMLIVTFNRFRPAFREWIESLAFGLAVVCVAMLLSFTTSVGERPATSAIALFVCAGFCGLNAARSVLPLFRVAFPGQAKPSGAPNSGSGANEKNDGLERS